MLLMDYEADHFERELPDVPIDHIAEFIGTVGYMVKLARLMAEDYAESYRDFRVGCAGYGIKHDNAYEIITGANLKPHRRARKYCAEMDVLDQAKSSDIVYMPGLVIAGPSDREKIRSVTGGRELPTLHPCGACVDRMQSSPMIHNDSIIVTVPTEVDQPWMEVHTFEQFYLDAIDSENENTRYSAPRYFLDSRGWGARKDYYQDMMVVAPNVDPVKLALRAIKMTVRD